MSMLAERKIKQRWSLNPRGNSWMKDENNIGQKMLAKMGWSHGKGLGANENGIKEQIKVNYKNDNKGMGYKGNDEQWIEHEDNFNQLLETLSNDNNGNNTDTNGNKTVSLVERSQSSKVRVHYRKFTHGKDLSQYSQKDLANIFGKKSLNDCKTIENSNNGSKRGGFEGSFLKNRGSMIDYFQQKSKRFQSVYNNDDDDNDDESQIRCGFGFNTSPNENKRKIEDDDEISIESKKKKKIDDLVVNDSLENPQIMKKKKKNEIVEDSENSTVDNLSFNETFENSQEFSGVKKKKKIVKNEIDDENSQKGRNKLKNKKIEENDATDNPVFKNLDSSLENSQENQDEENRNSPVAGKVKKRLKNKKIEENNAIDNGAFDGFDPNLENSQEDCFNTNFPMAGKIEKRSKSKKIKENGAIDNPGFDGLKSSLENCNQIENHQDEENRNFPVVGKVKKRIKNKKIQENNAIDNPAFDDLDSSLENCDEIRNHQDEQNRNFPVVGKVKKRLKNKKIQENNAIDNLAFDGLDSSSETLQENYSNKENSQQNPNANFPIVGKLETKLKNRKIKENAAIDNPAFDNFDSSLENSQENSGENRNFPVVGKIKKRLKNKKIKENAAIDNPAFNDSDSSLENSHENCSNNENSQRNQNKNFPLIGKIKKRLKNKENGAIDNPAFDSFDSSLENSQKLKKRKTNENVENCKKKREKIETNGIDNVVFNENLGNSPHTNHDGNFEIKRKIDGDSKIPFDNPAFDDYTGSNQTTPLPSTTTTTEIEEEIACDLMLNTVTTPILKTTNHRGGNKGGKSVRFSDTNHERIIPNNQEQLMELTEINSLVINNNLEKFSKRIDSLEAEIENDMNEAKLNNFNNNDSVLLKFDGNIKWGKIPIWLLKTKCKAKSSYKHLIKGDVIVNFKNTNFGEIQGYGKNLQK